MSARRRLRGRLARAGWEAKHAASRYAGGALRAGDPEAARALLAKLARSGRVKEAGEALRRLNPAAFDAWTRQHLATWAERTLPAGERRAAMAAIRKYVLLYRDAPTHMSWPEMLRSADAEGLLRRGNPRGGKRVGAGRKPKGQESPEARQSAEDEAFYDALRSSHLAAPASDARSRVWYARMYEKMLPLIRDPRKRRRMRDFAVGLLKDVPLEGWLKSPLGSGGVPKRARAGLLGRVVRKPIHGELGERENPDLTARQESKLGTILAQLKARLAAIRTAKAAARNVSRTKLRRLGLGGLPLQGDVARLRAMKAIAKRRKNPDFYVVTVGTKNVIGIVDAGSEFDALTKARQKFGEDVYVASRSALTMRGPRTLRRKNPTLLIAHNPGDGKRVLNPRLMADPKFRAALALFRKRFGEDPVELVRVKDAPPGLEKYRYLVGLGRAPDVSYAPNKRLKLGKGPAFLHKWETEPLLAVSADSKFLGYLDRGPGYRVSVGGIHG